MSRARRWNDVDPTRRGIVLAVPATTPRREILDWIVAAAGLLAWLSFTVTFAIARLVTGVIKIFQSDAADLKAGGVHLHHYLWGILLLAGVAIFGLVDRSPRARSWMGIALGVGLALIVDEIALLVTLKDVYWQTVGWSSVAALGLADGGDAEMVAARLRGGVLAGPAPADTGLDEVVDIPVEHRLRVADLMLGTQVLHHLIRVQHVGPHLVAPAVALALERIH